tara:strand:- start:627 stop:956 length:330 start_codon:yes stop_codon:yes gene_type:complete
MTYLLALMGFATFSGIGHFCAFYLFGTSRPDKDGWLNPGPLVIGAIILVIIYVGVFGYGYVNTLNWLVGSHFAGALIGGFYGFRKGYARIRKSQENRSGWSVTFKSRTT